MKNPTTVRRIELVTRLFDNEGKEIISLEKVKEILEEHKKAIKFYTIILHDKDVKSTGENSEELVAPHFHIGIKFNDNMPQRIETIANWFSLPKNYFEKIKGKWINYLLYLIHANAPNKYQYPPENVIANFDYKTEIVKAQQRVNIDNILNSIIDGTIRNITEIDGVLYVNYANQIKEAFKYRNQLLAKTLDRDVEVIMITGGSGTGKSTLAKKIADEKGLDVYFSGGSKDPLQNYQNEQVVVFDDFRPSTMNFSDFLKAIDPYNNTSINSRYYNKTLDCKLIIITSILPIEDFYHNLQESYSEPILQLKRRIKTYIQMTKTEICIQRWNDIDMKYSKPVIYCNDTLVEFVAQKIVDEKAPKEEIEELLPFLRGKEVKICQTNSCKTKTDKIEVDGEIDVKKLLKWKINYT